MEIAEQEVIVSIKNLGKSFVGTEVLKSVDLDVHKGENVVVLGKSGSGKSTLIKCLIGLMDPDEGEISVFGKNISSLTYQELNETRVILGSSSIGAPCLISGGSINVINSGSINSLRLRNQRKIETTFEATRNIATTRRVTFGTAGQT